MNSDSKYVITIPSIDIPGHLSIDDLILLGSNDDRYQQLKKSNTFLSKYLDSFRAPFGTKINPSIIVRDKNLPKVNSDHLVSFRNVIAVSSVIYSRIRSCLLDIATGCTSTDLFDFHPISVSNDGNDFSVKTAYTIGVNGRIDKFKGQASLSEPYPENIRFESDEQLTLSLLNLIEKKYNKIEDKEFRSRIIRSIEMAYYALRSPFIQLGNKTDFGIGICLWVSAFEIIAYHYKRNKNVGFCDVSSLIKSVPWKNCLLRKKNRMGVHGTSGKPKTKKKTTLPVQIYSRLYYTRNMYLHGVPIPKNKYEFRTRRNWGNLFFQVPALYRCILMHLLKAKGCIPATQKMWLQNDYEKVLLMTKSQQSV
ncbi:MAG: hypothetical protein ACYS9C_12780 [Planctomycetota bacterium]|jgi:hypothetical protein